MARALLLALTCAATASAARYVDYGGGKMPAYGAGDYDVPRDTGAGAAAPSYDYRGHSPDAPASPDYKFEDAPRVKTETPAKDSDETEVWRKPGRKQRGLGRPPIESGAESNAHARDEEVAPRTRDRYAKHRSRLKSEPGDPAPAHPAHPARRPNKYSRDRKDDVSDIDTKDYFHVDKDDFPDDKSKEFEEDVKFVKEATTRRARRKPRDRFVKRKSSDLDVDMLYDEEDMEPRMKVGEPERPRPTEPPVPAAARTHPRPRFHAPEDEDEDLRAPATGARRPRPYDDYDDYYDMKRVHSINNKLPSLLRRTTEWVPPPTPTRYLDMLWTNRRMLPDEDTMPPSSSTERVPSPRPHTLTTSSATRRTRTTTPPTTTISTTTVNATALSLAEKSRLSILKKDQRKKGQHMDAPTQKPAVLLQVTQMLPTVVMVEPPSSAHPWLRMRDLSEDSPEHIEKVKRIMRHKLVGEAKSIHDLTSNWDEMVCDYVDVALLDEGDRSRAASLRRPCALFTTLCLVILVCRCA